MKINAKIGIFTASIILFVVLLLSYGVFLFQREDRIQEVEEEQKTILRSFIRLSEEALVVHDELLLLNNMMAIKNTYPGVKYINFYNLNTERLFYTDEDKSSRVYRVRDIHDTWEEENEISAPVFVSADKIGVAQIGFSELYYRQMIDESIKKARNNIMRVSIIALLLGTLVALLLSRTITNPIRKLAEGAHSIGEGDLSTEIEIDSGDEIGMLAEEFNEMAEKLAELDRAKDDFISSVSHELRTPMAAIEGYIDLLLARGSDVPEEKRKKALNIMKISTRRLTGFVDDILDIAKIKAGMVDLRRESCRVEDIIDKTATLMEFVAQKKDIEIVIQTGSELPYVDADSEKVQQVLTNLIGNALKFTPEGGTVTISAEADDGQFVKVHVKDTGPGIPEEDLDKIFRQFAQTDEARNIDGPKGTGLGLAIAQGIVQAHGGRIWADSDPGSGAVFSFTLPVAREEEYE